MIGALCITKAGDFSDSDIRLAEFLADSLAGTFDRLAQTRAVPPSTPATQTKVRRMAYMAQHDALTGLPNRWLLNERLAQALALSIRHGRRLAVLFLDVDRFKDINDSLGHGVGDQVLREISERLVRCVRTSDTVSRIGGDEFIILLSELEDEKDAMKCAEKLNAEVQDRSVWLGTNSVLPSASVSAFIPAMETMQRLCFEMRIPRCIVQRETGRGITTASGRMTTRPLSQPQNHPPDPLGN